MTEILTPLVSILMPSRNRPALCEQAISELLGKSDNPDNLDILVYVDDDDPAIHAYTLVQKKLKFRLFFGPHEDGYASLHHKINQLADYSLGKWLMIYNDDAIMETSRWEVGFNNFDSGKPLVLSLCPLDQLNIFPIISRKLYEAMGHFSLSAHSDSWVEYIGRELGIMRHCPGVSIKHIRETLSDQTRTEVQSVSGQTSSLFFSPELIKLREEDKEKIRKFL